MNALLFSALLAVTYAPEDFGPVDGIDDHVEIQAALDAVEFGGGTVVLEQGKTYYTTQPVRITMHATKVVGNWATISYTGPEEALRGDYRNGDNYPVSSKIEDLAVYLYTEGAIGFNLTLSHTNMTRLTAVLSADDQIGFLVPGDSGGTGPYYNVCTQCNVQGNAHLGSTGQRGFYFTSDPSTPTRGPNHNSFIAGRVGQVETAWEVLGAGNTLTGTAAEGITGDAFVFDHPSVSSGSISNTVIGAYSESGGLSGHHFKVGPNAASIAVINPYITGSGAASAYSDEGRDTKIIGPSRVTFAPTSFEIKQTSSAYPPVVSGPYPGFILDDNGYRVRIDNSKQWSTALRAFRVYDLTNSVQLLGLGTLEADLGARRLYLSNGTLRVAVDAPVAVVSGETPSVYDLRTVKTSNANPTALTDFVNGYDGQHLAVVFGDAQTTLYTGAGIEGLPCLYGCAMPLNCKIDCVHDGATWFCK